MKTHKERRVYSFTCALIFSTGNLVRFAVLSMLTIDYQENEGFSGDFLSTDKITNVGPGANNVVRENYKVI